MVVVKLDILVKQIEGFVYKIHVYQKHVLHWEEIVEQLVMGVGGL